MTQDEIVAMAVKAKLIFSAEDRITRWDEKTDLTKYLIRFAKLVAEKEREKCAEIAKWHREMAHEIRRRGQA